MHCTVRQFGHHAESFHGSEPACIGCTEEDEQLTGVFQHRQWERVLVR
ncbi:MAG: hypothetical protein JSS38_13105 [Nitrospira sp.]|nr:hypothetical protein [Nitrospira sp.]MBS0155529.1 hypothetical protein [Nitrospira sp.]MBS0167819.1 hypothetical protein [Nitrospira sp.]